MDHNILNPVVNPGFPRPGGATPKGRYQPIILPNFTENEENWTGIGFTLFIFPSLLQSCRF